MRNLPKRIFYAGIILISIFEILNVYFIMPMPGSQEINSIDTAYFVYTYRWYFRFIAGVLIAAGLLPVLKSKPVILPVISLIAAIVIIYFFNFQMNAESMFKQPGKLILKPKDENRVSDSSLVICVENNGQVKAYPVKFLAYHHQIQDTIGNLPTIITYCSVCRTGRVFIPEIRGKAEKFRLVGMDHYNAMFEDATTKSWWRQATGEAIAGPLAGEDLETVGSAQMTIWKLFDLYPHALVMQADEDANGNYDLSGDFEQGKSKSKLIGTDTLSWGKKSWVIGVQAGLFKKVYDWNYLKKHRIINDIIGITPVTIVLSTDKQSFAAFERPVDTINFSIQSDTIIAGGLTYDFSGKSFVNNTTELKKIKAYQEFWHSWNTFHSESQVFEIPGN